MKTIVRQYETDWLASRPIFYNTKTLKVSHNINDVIDFSDVELHPEGFNNYLDFGYSVFEQTAIKNVKFMRYSSKLRIYDDNSFELEYLPDPVDPWFGKTTREEDVLELLQKKISSWEKGISGEIVLPLSGGFDSRLLASMVSDKSRLRCFTYGVSPSQTESYEVVHAQKVAELLHLKWRQIKLGNYHNYFDYWNNLFGVSTHAHGMYHIEFYKEILKEYTGALNFLSGIFGDVWAGSVEKQAIHKLQDIYKLGYTHGLSATSDYSLLPHDNTIIQAFYNKNKDKLQFDFYQIITTIRLKIILISYLISVPEAFGFSVFSPYLDMEVALSMLCLPAERRKNRQWQKDYFERNMLNIEKLSLKKTFLNRLNFLAAQRIKLSPLDYKEYTFCIQKKYIDNINDMYLLRYPLLERFFDYILNNSQKSKLFRYLHIHGIVHRIHNLFWKENSGYHEQFIKKYCAYLTLKPLEYLFRK